MEKVSSSLRVSSFFLKYTYDYGIAKYHLLHNHMTGDAFSIDEATGFIWPFIKNQKNSLLKDMYSIAPKQLLYLKEKKVLIQDSPEAELNSLKLSYPTVRNGILFWEDGHGLVNICYALPQKCFTSKERCSFLILDTNESKFFSMCDGRTTLQNILKKLKIKFSSDIFNNKLFDSKYQFIHLKPTPLQYEFGIKLPCNVSHKKSLQKTLGQTTHVNLKEYHRKKILNAKNQFSNMKITVSHALRCKSEAFGGLSYGEAFCEAVKRVSRDRKFENILEVGDGIGIFAKEFLEHPSSPHSQYTVLDLSPTLQKSQNKHLCLVKQKLSLINRDATKFKKKQTYDLIISNEAIANFLTTRLKKDNLKKTRHDSYTQESIERIKKYKLNISDAPKEFHFNLGAIKFLENTFYNLKDRGMAFISEYGFYNSYPKAIYRRAHHEYSIHWGHLLNAAKAIGFNLAELQDLPTFLSLNHQAKAYAGNTSVLLHSLKKFGYALEPRVFFKKEVKELFRNIQDKQAVKIRGDKYLKMKEYRYWGPSMDKFKVLILVK